MIKVQDWEIELYFMEKRKGEFEISDTVKRNVRAYLNRGYDPLEKPITKESRARGGNDGESITFYWVDAEMRGSDAEIEKAISDLEIHNGSPYDCSGRLCTLWIIWKRCPAGVAIVHHMALDI